METNVPNTDGAGEDLLPYLERLWREPAKAPPHDPQRTGWLVCAWVFALIGCGGALAAIATVSVVPLSVTAGAGLVSFFIVVLHQHARSRRKSRWH